MSTITKEQAQKIIEAADEVITALAGTNEDVHPESDSMLRLWDDLNDRYAPPEVVRELARIALASLEAEAVGFIARHKETGGFSSYLHPKADWFKNDEYQVLNAYTAPPAPENSEPVAWLWSHRKHPSEVTLVRPEDDERAEGAHWSGWSCQALFAEQAPVSLPDAIEPTVEAIKRILPTSNPDDYAACIGADMWNACRAAMLQNGNSPAQSDCCPEQNCIAPAQDGKSPVIPDCSCHTCRPVTFADSRFVVCPECGNKRCPHANDHRNACTGSNEPGQEGSAYPAAPQQEVKP